MNFQNYVRTPFAIKALEVTEENFEDVAAFCGKSIEVTSKGDRYIFVNRRIIPTGSKIFVGWWITLMDDNVRCYPPRSFNSQFVPLEATTEFVVEPPVESAVDSSQKLGENAAASLEAAIEANQDIVKLLTTNSPIDLEADED